MIELAGVHDPAKAASIIGKTAQLELYDLETSLTGPSVTPTGNPQETLGLDKLLANVQSEAKKGQPEGYYAFGKNKQKSVGLATTRAAALKQAKQAHLKPPFTALAVPHDTVVITCDSTEVVCPGNLPQQGNAIPPPPKGKRYFYLFTHNQNKTVVDDATDYAEAQPDPQPSTAMRWVFAEEWPSEAPPPWGLGPEAGVADGDGAGGAGGGGH